MLVRQYFTQNDTYGICRAGLANEKMSDTWFFDRVSLIFCPYVEAIDLFTEIYFDELPNGRIAVCTHNTDLKKRLTAFAEQYSNHRTMTDEDSEIGYKAFEVEKGRLSFRLTAPYSEERRQAASKYAKQNGITSER